ncbi:MAG: cytochrome d ubiquinol oxidase, subunit [Actinobacteria bacterium]|nr:cytochrome d ubiquinol oxidase, subunit [Actinomycetota bacterium]
MGAVIAVSWLLHERLEGWAFVATAVTIVLVTATRLLNLYPRVMVSSLGPANGRTIDNAASGHYTLRLMAIVAAIFTPRRGPHRRDLRGRGGGDTAEHGTHAELLALGGGATPAGGSGSREVS